MESFVQNAESYMLTYITIVFCIPWLVLVYWVVKFHYAVKEVMGAEYTSWGAFKYSAKYAADNKEFGKVFYKRNLCFAIVLVIWVVGAIGFVGLFYMTQDANSNKAVQLGHTSAAFELCSPLRYGSTIQTPLRHAG